MSVINLWVGGTTSTSARVNAKTSGGVSSVELLVSTSPDLSGATTFGPQTPDGQDVVDFTATGLSPGTRYFYALDEDSTFDPQVDPIGTFLTDTSSSTGPFSVTVAVGGCQGAGPPAFPGDGSELDPAHVSNHPVFAEIRNRALAEDWRALIQTGDLNYYDIGTVLAASLANYRTAIDDVLHQSNFQTMVRDLPFAYTYHDHDFGGNNSNGTYEHKLLVQQVFRERVPSHPLPAPGTSEINNPVYHHFTMAGGRVLVIMSDTRSSRSPDGDPDGPDKTVLGANQKSWMADLLSTTSAEFLVWNAQEVWLEGGGSWAAYPTEQAELVDLFTQTGFVDRMLVVCGDSHFMAIDDGTHTPGGMPLFCANHLDSNPGNSSFPFSEGPVLNSKGQYGTVTITNDGDDTIAITLQGWRYQTGLIRQFSFTVGESEPQPEPEPSGLPQVAQAQTRTEITWLSFNLASGGLIGELPDLRSDRLRRVLGSAESAKLTVPIPKVGGRGLLPTERADLARRLTAPTETLLVAVINSVPTWAGIPMDPDGGTDAELIIPCVTLEGYLDHRYTRDHDWVDQDEAEVIAAGLLGDANAGEGGIGGGIDLIIDAPPTGRGRERHYRDHDNGTVYEDLRELMGVRDGPEFTIDLDWADSGQTRLAKIARVRKRIGRASSSPSAIFQTTPSPVFSSQGAASVRYRQKRLHSSGKFANVVRAYSSGQGEDKPVSDPQIDVGQLEAGKPIWERRYQPASNISDIDTLNDHAGAELSRVRRGARQWHITAIWNAWPRYGVDWQIGDDVAAELTGHLHPSSLPGRAGVNVIGRALGLELSTESGEIVPLLLEPLEV